MIISKSIPLIHYKTISTKHARKSLLISGGREENIGNTVKVRRKEIFSGLLLGSILGAIGFIRILIWHETGLYDYGEFWLWIGLSVSVSLVFVVLWGTLSGSMIPFILKRMGLDPATASAPFVATLVDVTGLIIYFSVAAVLLMGKLL